MAFKNISTNLQLINEYPKLGVLPPRHAFVNQDHGLDRPASIANAFKSLHMRLPTIDNTEIKGQKTFYL